MKKNYITGIIGSLIGGFLATIPWILMYVYGGMILSALAIIIAIGALKGYQLCKGIIDKKLPIIIIIISIICVTISTLVIIPLMLLNKEGIAATFQNLNILYNNDEFVSALIKDYIISLLFTILGISGVIANIKKQIKNGESNIKAFSNNEIVNNLNSEKEKVKEEFIKLNATDKYTAVEKEIILGKIDEKIFKQLKMQQIIVKYKGKYYYSLKNEKSFFRRFIKLYLKMMAVILIIALIFIFFIGLGGN